MVVLRFLSIFFLLNIESHVAAKVELPTTPLQSKLQTYIVHVEQPKIRLVGESSNDHIESWYMSFIPKSTETTVEQPQLLYSYRNVMSGFSARLTIEQVKAMEKKDGFISAMPETIMSLHTTHTPEYLGLNQQFGIWKNSNFGKGVIVGVLDTGIHPNHPSFNDEGMSPPPAKWKGKCEFNSSLCNNKLIGARTFNLGNNFLMEESPNDEKGHGTHTASTAAGAFVEDAEALGNAKGKAAGIAPLAHLAIYKVCSGKRCPSSDVFAGIDAAIDDGVDVLSISLGSRSVPFFKDNIAVATFGAIQKGIFVSSSAGNSGPLNSTLSNDAPWILTVGASTINRRIVAVAKLGNGEQYEGESLYQPNDFPSKFLPLVYAGNRENKTYAFCGEGSLENMDVKGKVVVCEGKGGVGRVAKGLVVKNAGGAAMILINQEEDGFSTLSEAHVLPATHVSYKAGVLIKSYINSSQNPTASISFKGTVIGDGDDFSAPSMASFSSRGPCLPSPGILKPDITGPGVNILAAWPFPLDNDTNTKSTFNVISGTSMSCPHLSGIAALIKSVHPNWSPAAIKSAIMTTANIKTPQGEPIVDQDLQPANFFAMGAGHVNPSKAADPGLVYDIQPDDYIPYLCGLYKDEEVSIIVHRTVICGLVPSIREGDLNYPSFSVALGGLQTFKRTVTNVGEANSVYTAIVEAPLGVSMTVMPRKLFFSRVNQTMTFTVTFNRIRWVKIVGEFGEGYLKWVSKSKKYVVRSPVSVKFI
ncbi:hypothetical protein IC582_022296 [Cucumis melo]|uniref:Subtilisin-like protease SBT1.7 n=1 Tax=Cucumis melo var. makuwa TaxID=1194695 RepID=A0A5A7TMM4_CUCMM|nr:subtilisin-like protease SBT1.7 [Cucumis melo var. makuwa]